MGWDGRGSQRWTEYDDQIRPIAAFEHAVDAGFLCAERFAYGSDNPAFSARNQCGQLIRHDDPSGTQLFEQFGLAGEVLQQTRHFLQTLESPDWPASVSERDTLLEPGAGFTARARFNPLGEAIEQTDAKGNRQMISHTVDGLLHEVRLQLAKDVAPKVLVSAIQYNALGQTVRETAGNGVITSLDYAADDGRLSRLQAKRGNDALQDLRYAYDSVGNVLSIEDAALPVRYFANQRVEPVNRYVYDSLYQLINATGWEAGGSNQGPTFSRFDDPASCANYSQTYRYDRGGNLLELTHDGPQSHGHRLVAAAQSNRCLPVINGVEPSEEDFRNSFDSSGNLLNLQPGQSLRWDLRNQLREVRPVANDRERYVYGANGMRVRKVRSTQTNARTLISEVRYLPGLELRTHSGTGEALQVITVQAGRSSVRVLHWESEPPKDIANDQYRYSFNDHLGSCALELDSSGDIISQERYHPFGTTAWFAGRGDVEASYKTVRYSGQERDATGLYYYGFRYYATWLQRWLSPDPAGSIDGLNFYVMVRNNPVRFRDRKGLQGEDFFDATFHRLDLSAQGWAKHALDKGLTATTLQRFNKATGRYSETFDFEVLEVGTAEFSLAGEKVIETLAGFQKKYDELARIEYSSGKGKSPLHESMVAAAKHAERMHDFAKEAYQGDSAAASITNKNRFFALVQRVKPDYGNQQLLAVQKISMSQPDSSTHRAFVSGVVLHPLTRLDVRARFRDQPGKEAIPILQVARTFMTIKSLNKANKDMPLKDVMFGSTNSDDLKVPGRLGAKVTHEPTHVPLPKIAAGSLRR